MKRKYKVLIGTHSEGGKTYTKDQVVVSGSDLVAMFPNKFEDAGLVKEEPIPAKPEPSSDRGSGVASATPASKRGG